MDGVSTAIQELDGSSTGTVRGAKTHSHSESLSLSANTPPERAQPSKPEVAPKPVITRQPSVLVPCSQIWSGEGSLFLPLAVSAEELHLGSSAAFSHPFHPETGIGNRDQMTSPEARMLTL